MKRVNEESPLDPPFRAARTKGETDGWIAVEERLPKPMTDVLIVLADEAHYPVDLGFIDWTGVWRLSGAAAGEMRVTHWMPLPEPPRGALEVAA